VLFFSEEAYQPSDNKACEDLSLRDILKASEHLAVFWKLIPPSMQEVERS
jgi:hypothetical protein